jgi:hypothetical protein
MPDINNDYYTRLAQIESGNNPNARASTSSASGLYQFTRDTWEGLGYAWSQVFDPVIQNLAIRRFTESNARRLSGAGIEVNSSNLYAAHFLGAGGAIEVLSSSGSTMLRDIVSPAAIRANSFLANMSVADFRNWLGRKMGQAQSFLNGAANPLSDLPSLGDILAQSPYETLGNIGGNVGTAANVAGNGVVNWLKDFFSVDTAARVISVIVGIALVIIAIAVLMNSDKG